MNPNRYTFRTLPEHLRDPEQWPAADLSQQDAPTQLRFERLARGLRLYLKTGALGAGSREAGCSRPSLIDQLNRCVQPRADGAPVGWPALVAYQRVTRYERRAQPPTGKGQAGLGGAGAFEQFLADHEALRDALHTLVRKGGGQKSTASARPSLKGVATRFVKLCRASGLGDEDYPLNSKSRGRRSIERYARALIARDAPSMATWYGEQASTELLLGAPTRTFEFAAAPLDVVAMDAHKLHCVGTVVIPGPAGPQDVPIERLWLDAVIDKRSRAAFGYSVSIAKELSAAEVEEALVSCTRPWKPRELSMQGLRYAPGAGFPVGTVPGLAACRPAVIVLDNASQHWAARITDRVRRAFGCALTFGPVGAWWHNPIIERLFLTLEQHGFQCLPSSTGSHPADRLRGNFVAQAVRHSIRWEELVDLVDVLLANYNATPHSALGGQTPLMVLNNHLCAQRGFLPRPSVPITVNTPRLGWSVERRRISGRCDRHHVVRPYVEIDKVRYTNSVLCTHFDWLGATLVTHILDANCLCVLAFSPTGEALGELTPLDRAWASTPHTRAMRKQINALLRNGSMDRDTDDFVLSYLDYLAEKTLHEVHGARATVSPTATQLANAARVSGAPIPQVPRAASGTDTPTPLRPLLPGHIPPPPWA